MEIHRVGDFTLGWGESAVWDEQRSRLYFVDCLAQSLHWLDAGSEAPATWTLPSMPTGIVPAADGRIVAVLDDGLYALDADTEHCELLSRYPDEIGGRCNDACADLDGNLITGKLNLGPAEGSTWWYSAARGWRLLDPDISNTNGPTVAMLDGAMTLIVGDTSTNYYSYPYDAATGTVGDRSVFGDVGSLDGMPDGATLDRDGGLWCALVGGAQLARFTSTGLDTTLALPVTNPTDVTFGGADLDRMFVTSIAGPPGTTGLDGALLVVEGLGRQGRVEPRVALGG